MKLSLVIPTYNEKENIENLILEILSNFDKNKINGEIIIVDDNSEDQTGVIVENMKEKYNNIYVIHRDGKLGLSSAVLEGFMVSNGEILGVMDADLSHPVDKINEMFQSIQNGADMAIGSRYIKGGHIKGWNLHRKVLSKGATLLARIFTEVKDPMSGFFMFKKEYFVKENINSKGFKILLELLVKLNYKQIVEIPYVFINRTKGKSKANTGEIIYYLENLIKYLPYKKEIILQFIRFAFVGIIGTLLNIIILYILTEYYQVYYVLSAIISFVIAITLNYFLNKMWTFRELIGNSIVNKYFKFFAVGLIALSVNVFFLYILTEVFKFYYIISQIVAISLSFFINFIGNKIWTFSK